VCAGLCVLVAVVAMACGDTRAPDAPTSLPSGGAPAPSSFEQTVLTLVNERRAAGATCGDTTHPPVAPLTRQVQLEQAARAHSEDMAAQNYFSHTSLDGRTFSQRIRDTGYMGSPIGENIAAGYSTPQAVVSGWMDSPAHCGNIMLANYGVLGVGYAFDAASTYGHYWTQNFGGT
jgi:uncharacterized protein YkwD